ncbi:MAG: hypothetical protein IIC67_09890 [Thaumarchaeota archaeon]|nr:hypothetical protein [Nitrososphaerota archaeon]
MNIPQAYRKHKDMPIFMTLALDLTNFNFYKFNESIDTKFKSLDEIKNKTIHVLEKLSPNYVKTEFRDKFASFVPSSDDVLKNIGTFVDDELKIDVDLFLMFYGEKYDSVLCDASYQKIVDQKISLLSKFLIRHKLIDVNDENAISNISSIFEYEPKFDRIIIQSMYQKYSNFDEITKKMIKFYNDEEIIGIDSLKYADLVKILKTSSNDRLENIQSISDKLIESNTAFTNSLKSISKACCCLFLASFGDVSSHRSCEIMSSDPLATEILYHNMDLQDDQSLVTKKHTLNEIILNVSSNKQLNLKFLPVFKLGLASGLVYGGIKEMMLRQMNSVDDEILKIAVIQDELDEMKSSLKTVLDTELEIDETLLQYAIQSQIVQAYMITKKGSSPSLPILENIPVLTEAAEKTNLGIPIEEFLILGDKKDTPGHSTRIGIVPLRMNFDEFSKKFNKMYNNAVESQVGTDVSLKSKFSLNMIRIMTSPATFNPIRFTDTDNEGLLHTIQNLLKSHFSNTDKIQLVATFQNDTGKIGIRGILEKTFNKNSLYFFIEKELRTKIPDVSLITNAMNVDSFDAKLYQSYNVENFAKLCIQIHNAKQTSDDERLVNVLTSHLTMLLQGQNPQITPQDCHQVSILLFVKLSKFGNVLSN